MAEPDDTSARPAGFYGRRHGKKLRPLQASRFEHDLPRLAIDPAIPLPMPLAGLFPVPVGLVRLEIGFGGGEHLIAEAQRHPHIGFIGAEAFVNGLAKVTSTIVEHDLRNIRLHGDDVVPLLDRLPAGGLDQVDLLYPDPWPKRRHWKRRFVRPDNLDRLARILRPGGRFRFATDVADYAAWTLRHILSDPRFEWTARRSRDWIEPFEGWPGTRYEAKAVREGRNPGYYEFRRTPLPC